jgi:exodeoxyribonuclease-3
MRIISFNANGIRSAATKGFLDWFRAQDADVLCIQETKAQEDQLTDPMFRPDGHHCFYRDAITKKGYSGVAIYSKREPDQVITSLGWAPFDDEGRYIEARYGNLSVVSFYIPSGSSGDLRQGFKFEVMEWLRPILEAWRAAAATTCCAVTGTSCVRRWTSRTGSPTRRTPAACRRARLAQRAVRRPRPGHRCRRRPWVGRCLPPAQPHRRGLHLVEQPRRRPCQQCRLAHRLPVHHPGLRDRLRSCSIYRDERFSDHAPFTVDYDL